MGNPLPQEKVVGWIRHPRQWSKCNVGVSWSRNTNLTCSAWVLRDHQGVVIVHSRRAFSNISDRDEAELLTLLWTVESMASIKVNKVIFEVQIHKLVGDVKRPKAWRNFKYQAAALNNALWLSEIGKCSMSQDQRTEEPIS